MRRDSCCQVRSGSGGDLSGCSVRALAIIALAGCLLTFNVGYAIAGDLIAIATLGSGSAHVFDAGTGRRLTTIAVEDGAGIAGIAVSPDGAAMYVVDGNTRHRLRQFETHDWRETLSREFANRVLLLSAGPVIHATADGRWVLVPTADPGAASSGVRIFETTRGAFAPLGLSSEGCPRPRFTSAATGTVAMICQEELRLWTSPASEMLSASATRRLPADGIAGAVITPDAAAVLAIDNAGVGRQAKLLRIPLRMDEPIETAALTALLGTTPRSGGNDPSILDVSRDGARATVVKGTDAVLLDPARLTSLKRIRLTAPAAAAKLSANGDVLYTLSREVGRLHLHRINVATGAVGDVVLLEDLPEAPIAWHVWIEPRQP